MAQPEPPMHDPRIRVIMRPRDLNHQGVVFGGVVLSHIDEGGVVEDKRQAYHRYVTMSLGRVVFKAPIHGPAPIHDTASQCQSVRPKLILRLPVKRKEAGVQGERPA